MKNIKFKQVEKLICWPKGTIGYEREKDAIITIIKLCNDNGYGRIPHLAQQIMDVWEGKDLTKVFKSIKEHIKFISDVKNKPIPRFVSLNTVELIYSKESNYYWRENGGWGVEFYWDENVLKAKSNDSRLSHVNGLTLKPSSYKKWKKDNEGRCNSKNAKDASLEDPLIYDYRENNKDEDDNEPPF